MTPVEILVSYVIAWWLVFFMALPVGTVPPEQVEKGHADSAPDQPRLWIKVAATSIIAALLVWAFSWFVGSGLLAIRG